MIMTDKKQEIVGITIDKRTKKLLDVYVENHANSRSVALSVIVNNFFYKKG